MVEENLKVSTKRGLYWKAVEQFSNQIMQFVVGIVMARLLSPSDYGIAALPAVFMAIASVFIDGSFSTALIRKPEITEKDLSTSFYYSISVGIFCYVCIFFSAPLIADFFDTEILTPLMRVTALTFIIGPISTPQSVILNRRLDFKTPARIAVVNKIFSGATGIVAAYLGYGIWALVISQFTSTLLGLFQIWLAVKWYPKTKWSKESFNYLWKFGNKMIIARLLDNINSNIAPVIIGKFFSPSQLGMFNRAQGYAELPAMQINNIVKNVTFPILSKMQNDRDRLESNYRNIINTTCFIIFPVMFMMSALARPLIITLITEKWEGCIILLQILCFYLMWGPISMMNCNYLQVIGRTDVLLHTEYWKKAIGLVVMLLTLPFGLVPYCFGLVFIQLSCVLINMNAVQSVSSLKIMKQIKDVVPFFILSAVMFCVIHIVNIFIDNYWCQIFVGGIIGTIFYIGTSYIFKFKEIEYVLFLLKINK